MEMLKPKIKLKGVNKAADSVHSEGTQDQFKGSPVDVDANVRYGEGFFPVITGGIKRKRAPRAGERKAKEKQLFMINKGPAMQSVPVGEEDILDEEDNEGKEGIEEDARMNYQGQVMTDRNRVNVEPVEVKSTDQFQQRQGHLEVKVKTSKSQEGSSVPPEKPTSSDNEISLEYMKRWQKPASNILEKPSDLVLKPSRPLDQPTALRQSRSVLNDMKSSPLYSETEKLHSNSENQEKYMVQIPERICQKYRRQSHAYEKGPSDQSEYNKKELMDALMVVKKIMKMDAAEPFNTPVNPVALGIPDYFDIIDTPMDLGTICSALERGEKYRNSRDVYKDVQFVWENCYTYNRKGDPILDLMKRVKKNFVKYWTAAGLYYESPKRTAGWQYPGQGDTISSHEYDGVDESEMEHEGRDNPNGNKDAQTRSINFLTPAQLSVNFSESKDEKVSAEQVSEKSGRKEDKVCQKPAEETKVQYCVQESKALMDTVQSPLKDLMVENKGMKIKIKKSMFEHEVQENNGLNTEKEDHASIDEESGFKTSVSAKFIREETQHQDLHPKAKTRRRHGKYQHKDGCLCAVCIARRRRHAREENAQLAKGQSTIVDADLSEKMKEKVIEFPKKPLSNEDGFIPEHTSIANLIAHPGEQGFDQKAESYKQEVKGHEKEETHKNEGRGKHKQESRKRHFRGLKEVERQSEKEAQLEEEKESLMQQVEEDKESLMQLVEEEEQQGGNLSQKQQEEEMQEEETKDGQTQDDEETQQQEEGDMQQQEGDSGRYHPADYEIPLQHANPSILRMCELLFTRNRYSFWNQAHSLNYEPSKTVSENKILAAMSTFMD